MKMSILPLTVAAGIAAAVLLLALPGPRIEAQDQAAPSVAIQKWEYLVRRIDDRSRSRDRETGARHSAAEETMNQLGAQGWELVGVRNDGSSQPVFYFKRPAP